MFCFIDIACYNRLTMTQKKLRKYAVVDLEATGAGPNASIIQVGIVIIQGNKIIDSYETDVNPHESLDEHIVHLTGITDKQLVKAPDFGQVAHHIYQLIEDCIFVAHNVKFDANLLAEQLFLEGFELRTPRIDTVELSQVFYPCLEKYSLGALAESLNIELTDAHTAIADARATAQLFIKLKAKISSLPKEVLETILTFADNLLFESYLLIEEAYQEADFVNPKEYYFWQGLVLKKEKAVGKPKKLSSDFQVNMALLGMDARPKQIVFADLVKAHFNDQTTTFLEAQSGLGKTYGYLLPLLDQSQKQQIIVSVPTKILQDQIMAKEIKHIQELFHIPCHSIKGPRNYLKLDAFYKSLQVQDRNRLINRFKMQLLVWLTETTTGDLDEIKQKQRLESYFDQLKHDGEVTQSSLFYDLDFWKRSYDKVAQSQLVIINHAYFLERVQDDKDFAKGKVLVFDEAQKLVLGLENFSRGQLDISHQLQVIQKIIDSPIPLLQKRLLESISYELSHAAELFYRHNSFEFSETWLKRLKNSINALEVVGLDDLQTFFTATYTNYWFETDKVNEKRLTILRGAREDFLKFSEFLPPTKKTYMISATLQISPKVYLSDLLGGFSSISTEKIAHEKNANQKVWIDTSMPNILDLSPEQYAYEIAKRLQDIMTLKQPTLVLLTSKQTMFMVSDYLDKWEIKHLTQDKNGLAYNVKKRFDRGGSNLLLGTGSFWEGVDFVHRDRLIEVITRLPFDNPKDYFIQKLSQSLTKEGKNFFYDYSLPMTVLKLKQALGRTTRREEQKSAVIILDSRLVIKSYGQTIMHSLGRDFEISKEKINKVLTEMAKFLI